MGKFTRTSARESVIDYTTPFMFESAALVMRKPGTDGKNVSITFLGKAKTK